MALPPEIIRTFQRLYVLDLERQEQQLRARTVGHQKHANASELGGFYWTLPEDEDPFVNSLIARTHLIFNALMQSAQLNGLVLDEKAKGELAEFLRTSIGAEAEKLQQFAEEIGWTIHPVVWRFEFAPDMLVDLRKAAQVQTSIFTTELDLLMRPGSRDRPVAGPNRTTSFSVDGEFLGGVHRWTGTLQVVRSTEQSARDALGHAFDLIAIAIGRMDDTCGDALRIRDLVDQYHDEKFAERPDPIKLMHKLSELATAIEHKELMAEASSALRMALEWSSPSPQILWNRDD